MRFLALFSFVFLIACSTKKQDAADAYSLIPSASVMIIEINDITKFLSHSKENKVLHNLYQTEALSNFNAALNTFFSFVPEEKLQSFVEDRNFVFSIGLSGAEKYNLLGFTKTDLHFESFLSDTLSAHFVAQSNTYSGQYIYSFNDTANARTLHLCSYKGVLIFGLNKTLMQNAIRQAESEFNLTTKPDFTKLLNTKGTKDLANIFVNMAEAPALFKTLFSESQPRFMANMGSWLELDFQSLEKGLLLNGVMLYQQNQTSFTEIFRAIKPSRTEALAIIPSSFGMWLGYNFENSGQYYRNYLNYLEKNGILNEHEKFLEKLPANTPSQLNNLIDNEMGIFYSGKSNQKAKVFAYLRFRGSEEDCYKSLKNFSDTNFIEGYRGLMIKKINTQNLLARTYGNLFANFHFPYYTLKGNYILISESLANLKVLINDISDSKTLNKNPSFLEFYSELPSNNHISVFAGNPEFLDIVAENAPEAGSFLNTQHDSLVNLKWAALQLKANNHGTFVNFMVKHDIPLKEKVNRKWTTELDNEPIGHPQFLKNHINRKNDIAVCDETNKLYLLNLSGKILWDYQLDGEIEGEIRQIDIFKNNKLQMVFNTQSKLYVLDRLGRNVEGFPITLPEKATAPLGVFNYDNARNYRLVVPTGKKLLNYNVEGKPVKGWNFKSAKSDIISEPQHFEVAKKDIIVCLSADGKLFQLNRRGEERFVVDKKIEELKTSFYLKKGESLKQSELLAGSNSGKLYVINPEGKTDAIYLDETKPASHLIYFEGRYIFTHNEELLVKDENHPFAVEFEKDISEKPKAMILNNGFYVGAFSAEAEEIRLFNGNGELLEGFPIFAQGPFDMGSLNANGKLNIVTYSSDGTIICYEVE